MKAICIQQPWAWLIVSGHKDIENRSWPTKVRGRVAIHAGKKIDPAGIDFAKSRGIQLPEVLSLGGIIGEAVISDCVSSHDSPWFFGPYGFVISSAKFSPFVPMPGRLGFFPVNIQILP